MNGNAHSLGSSFDKISPENNVAQASKHANHYHSSSAKQRDHVNSHHEREHRPEPMENNGSHWNKIAANSASSHAHTSQQQNTLFNNEKRFKNYKLISDPLLRKGAQKVYRYDGVPSSPVRSNCFLYSLFATNATICLCRENYLFKLKTQGIGLIFCGLIIENQQNFKCLDSK